MGKICLIANFVKVKENSNEKDFLKISVLDSGLGISESEQGDLFKKGLEIDAEHEYNNEGSKIGLSICMNLIEILGGKILFSSKENNGSVFSILIPAERNEIEQEEFERKYQHLDSNLSLSDKIAENSNNLKNKYKIKINGKFKINKNL